MGVAGKLAAMYFNDIAFFVYSVVCMANIGINFKGCYFFLFRAPHRNYDDGDKPRYF